MAGREATILATQTRYALLTARRNPRVLVFGMVFPAVLLILFGSIFSSGTTHTERLGAGRIDTHAYFTAGLMAYAIMLQAFTQVAISVTTQRESGQLKRLRGTPMPAWTFMAAQVLRVLAFTVFMVALLLAIGVVAFGVKVPGAGVVGLVVYVALGTAAMVTLGLAASVLFNNADTAASAAPFFAVMLSFISGVFISINLLPGWLASIGRVFPLAHLADGLQRSLVTGGGTGLTSANVAVLAAWGLGGLVFAVRRFGWEPQGSEG